MDNNLYSDRYLDYGNPHNEPDNVCETCGEEIPEGEYYCSTKCDPDGGRDDW